MRFGLKKGYIRAKQQVTKQYVHMTYFPLVKIVQGEDCSSKIAKAVFEENIEKVLIVTGSKIKKLGLLENLMSQLDEYEIGYVIYDKVQSCPTLKNVEEASNYYKQNYCEGIIAVGGGSVIDCSKVVGINVHNTLGIKQLSLACSTHGLGKVKQAPSIFVAPTIAGAGSEVSPTAIIFDNVKNERLVFYTNKFMPRWVAIDPKLHITATPTQISEAGMIALTQAIESYIGVQSTSKSKKYAEQAVGEIFTQLPICFQETNNLPARTQMAKAAMNAALSARIGGIGYTNCISHCLATMYTISYGFASGVVLPFILEASFEEIYDLLADLAILSQTVQVVPDKKEIARQFIEKIKQLNTQLFLPKKLSQLQKEDISAIAKKAVKWATSQSSGSCLLSKKECEKLLTQLLPEVSMPTLRNRS